MVVEQTYYKELAKDKTLDNIYLDIELQKLSYSAHGLNNSTKTTWCNEHLSCIK